MKKIIFALAFMLMGTFAFANISLTNYEFSTIDLCENEYYVYFEGELVAEWTEPAPLDDDMNCTGDARIFFLE